jgi:hypothetical protein
MFIVLGAADVVATAGVLADADEDEEAAGDVAGALVLLLLPLLLQAARPSAAAAKAATAAARPIRWRVSPSAAPSGGTGGRSPERELRRTVRIAGK